MRNECDILREEFGKLVRGEFFGPVEYEVMTDLWYKLSIKPIGRRADTMIIMVTYSDISEYK